MFDPIEYFEILTDFIAIHKVNFHLLKSALSRAMELLIQMWSCLYEEALIYFSYRYRSWNGVCLIKCH